VTAEHHHHGQQEHAAERHGGGRRSHRQPAVAELDEHDQCQPADRQRQHGRLRAGSRRGDHQQQDPAGRTAPAPQYVDADQRQQHHQPAAQVLGRAAPDVIDQSLGRQDDAGVGVQGAAERGDGDRHRTGPGGARRQPVGQCEDPGRGRQQQREPADRVDQVGQVHPTGPGDGGGELVEEVVVVHPVAVDVRRLQREVVLRAGGQRLVERHVRRVRADVGVRRRALRPVAAHRVDRQPTGKGDEPAGQRAERTFHPAQAALPPARHHGRQDQDRSRPQPRPLLQSDGGAAQVDQQQHRGADQCTGRDILHQVVPDPARQPPDQQTGQGDPKDPEPDQRGDAGGRGLRLGHQPQHQYEQRQPRGRLDHRLAGDGADLDARDRGSRADTETGTGVREGRHAVQTFQAGWEVSPGVDDQCASAPRQGSGAHQPPALYCRREAPRRS
jgi:hypothetical protein